MKSRASKTEKKKNFDKFKKAVAETARWVFFVIYCTGILFLVLKTSPLNKPAQDSAGSFNES